MMLDNLLQIVSSSSLHVDNGTLFCKDWQVTNKEIIQYLIDNNCIEQTIDIDSISISNKISLELSCVELCKIGFYDTCERFISKNKYELPQNDFYILEDKIHSAEKSGIIIRKIKALQSFIESIRCISKHTFTDIDVLNVVISNEKQSVVISFDYSYKDIQNLTDEQFQKINDISSIINGDNLEKRNLFINELIDFVQDKKINNIKIVLDNILELHENCHNAYLFYISNFSSNKLKFEVNAKIVDYNQKIQSVINEAQTKLIAIPSAFVLAAVAMDFEGYILISSSKNIITIISLYIFSILIQLFLSNQKSILNIIGIDIEDFKNSFHEVNFITNKFVNVDKSLVRQKRRLRIIGAILWIIPIIYSLYLIVSIIFLKQ